MVNAGAALLPAILAALTTFLSLLFKPRELWLACQRRPLVPLTILASALGIWAIAVLLADARFRPPPAPAIASVQPYQIDWTRVALERIEAKKHTPASAIPAPVPAATGEPFILRGGPLRLGRVGAAPAEGVAPGLEILPALDGRIRRRAGRHRIHDSLQSRRAWNRVFGASCLIDPPDTFGAIFALDAVNGPQLWTVDTLDDVELKGFFGPPP